MLSEQVFLSGFSLPSTICLKVPLILSNSLKMPLLISVLYLIACVNLFEFYANLLMRNRRKKKCIRYQHDGDDSDDSDASGQGQVRISRAPTRTLKKPACDALVGGGVLSNGKSWSE